MALVVLHAIVALHMYSVIRYPVKRGATLLTPADHFPSVDTSVFRQVITLCERLPTYVAHERLLTTMFPTVCRQIKSVNKRLSTVVTAVRPLPRVCSPMTSYMTHMVRGVVAPLTLVSAVPADGAVTLLHVLVQTILSQIRRVAKVDAQVEKAFTCKVTSIAWQQKGMKSWLTMN